MTSPKLVELGFEKLDAGRFEHARTLLRGALSFSPENALAWLALALAAARLGDEKEAAFALVAARNMSVQIENLETRARFIETLDEVAQFSGAPSPTTR